MASQNHSGHHQVEPRQQRHAAELHARASHAQNGRDDIDGGSDASKSGNQERKRPIVRAVARRKRPCGQRRVRPPSHVWCIAGAVEPVSAQKAEVEKKSTQRRQPETEGIQPRKRHVARADHQRHEVVRKPKQDWHGHEENHGRAMHGEHAIEDLRRNKVVVREHQLDANDERFDHRRRPEIAGRRECRECPSRL